MTQASVLKVTANGTTTSPAHPPRRRLDHGTRPRPPASSSAAECSRGRSRHTRRDHDPRATRQASQARDLRGLPCQDRSRGFRAGELRCLRRLARPLSRARRWRPSPRLRQEWPAFHFPRRPRGRCQRQAARRAEVRPTNRELPAPAPHRRAADRPRNLTRQFIVYATGAPAHFGDRPCRWNRFSIKPPTKTWCSAIRTSRPSSKANSSKPNELRGSFHLHQARLFPAPVFARHQHVALALPFLDAMVPATFARDAKVLMPRRMSRHLQQPSASCPTILSRAGGPRLHALALPRGIARQPQRVHRFFQRRVASRCGWRASGGQLLLPPPRRIPATVGSAIPSRCSITWAAERIGDLTQFVAAYLRRECPAPSSRSLSRTGSRQRHHPVRGEGVGRVPAALPTGQRRSRSRSRSASSPSGRALWMQWPARRRALQRDVGCAIRAARLDQYFTGCAIFEKRIGDARR